MGTWNGFKYNLSKDNVVRIIPSSDMGMIESSIFQILNTYPGERVHLPDFGSRLKLLVYEPLDEFLAIQIKSEIKEAINRKDYRDWETDRKSTRLNSSHSAKSRMPSSA